MFELTKLFDSSESMFDLLSQKSFEFDSTDIITHHTVKPFETGRPDLIAMRYYGDPRLYWFILKTNGIPFGFTTRKKFKIDYSSFEYEPNNSEIYPGRILTILNRDFLNKMMRK